MKAQKPAGISYLITSGKGRRRTGLESFPAEIVDQAEEEVSRFQTLLSSPHRVEIWHMQLPRVSSFLTQLCWAYPV